MLLFRTWQGIDWKICFTWVAPGAFNGYVPLEKGLSDASLSTTRNNILATKNLVDDRVIFSCDPVNALGMTAMLGQMDVSRACYNASFTSILISSKSVYEKTGVTRHLELRDEDLAPDLRQAQQLRHPRTMDPQEYDNFSTAFNAAFEPRTIQLHDQG